MRSVSSSDARRRFGAPLDAAQREPLVIRRWNRDVAVLFSAEEYERLTAANVKEFQGFCDRIAKRAARRGLTAEALAELLPDDG
jgi:prevent-host-death family protein